MSASSGGVWNEIVRLLSSIVTEYDKFNFKELLNLLHSRKHDFLEYADAYEQFLSPLSHLVTDYIVENVPKISVLELHTYGNVSKTLLQYFVYIISKYRSRPNEVNQLTDISHIIISIKSLCDVSKYRVDRDRDAFASYIKSNDYDVPPDQKLPEGSKKERKKTTIPESFRFVVQSQLSRLLYEFSTDASLERVTGVETVLSKKIMRVFIENNESQLHALHAGDYLIDLCLLFPNLSPYFSKYDINLVQKSFELPMDYNEARSVITQLEGLYSEIGVLNSVLSLNIMEPLNEYKVRQITNMAGGSLYCAAHLITAMGIYEVLSTNSSSPGSANVKPLDEDAELIITDFVEKSIMIFECVQKILKSSTRVSAQSIQNNRMNCSYMLLRSLTNYIYSLAGCSSIKPSKDDKGKSKKQLPPGDPPTKYVWLKAQDAFSNGALALLSVALDSLTSLFQACAGESITDCDVDAACLTLTIPYTGLQRIACMFKLEPMNLIQFLIFLAPILYRKGCSLKGSPIPPPAPCKQRSSPTTVARVCDGESNSTSDSTTYFEDDIVSCSEEEGTTDDDDDSEPILGHWLEETILSANEDNVVNVIDTSDSSEALDSRDLKNGHRSTIVPQKGEIAGYMDGAGKIFTFLNDCVVLSEFAFVRQTLKDGFIDKYIVALAAVVRDVDREAAAVVRFFPMDILQQYKSFSARLMTFVHNMLSNNVLNETLQNFFLTCLGISPFSDSTAPWPMTIHPRSLSVMIQILLTRDDREIAYMNAWKRILETLRNALSRKGSVEATDTVFEDINVEHAQMLIFFFDSLSFISKKKLLLSVMEALVEAGDNMAEIRETVQFFYLARLLLFFDYMVKYLYESSSFITKQIRYNTIGPGLHGLERMVTTENSMQKVYANFKDLVLNFLAQVPTGDEGNKHPFFDLSGYEYSNQQTPKLDGLALNFILNSGTEDGNCTYTKLISCFLSVIRKMDICKMSFTAEVKHLKLCSIQYCISIAWRLLIQLPPNAEFLDRIMVTRSDSMEISPFMLYSIIWGPRCIQKLYVNWLKDMLSKQGHPADVRETLLRSVCEITSTPKYSSNLIYRMILSITANANNPDLMIERQDMPDLYSIVLCDVLLCKFHATVEETQRIQESSLSALITSVVNMVDDNADSNCVTLPTKAINDNVVQELMIPLVSLIKYLHVCIRSSTLYRIKSDTSRAYTTSDLALLGSVMAVSGYQCSNEKCLSISPLPKTVHAMMEKWNKTTYPDFDTTVLTSTSNIPETYALAMLNFHVSNISKEAQYSMNPSLKHLLFTIFKFICTHIMNLKDECGLYLKLADVVIPMLLDVSTVYLSAFLRVILRITIGEEAGTPCQVKLRKCVFKHIFTLIMNYSNGSFLADNGVNHESVLTECITWFDRQIGDSTGRTSIENFFREHNKPTYGLHSILLSVTSPHVRVANLYKLQVLDAFNKLFTVAEKNPDDRAIHGLMKFVPQLGILTKEELDEFFFYILYDHYLPTEKTYADFRADIINKRPSDIDPTIYLRHARQLISDGGPIPMKMAANLFLENLTNYINRECTREDKICTAYLLLDSLLKICGATLLCLDGFGFDDLFKTMIKLANIAGARGHFLLFEETLTWVEMHKVYLHSEALLTVSLCEPSKELTLLVDAVCYVLNYASDVLQAVCIASSTQTPSTVNWDNDVIPSGFDVGSDWPEEFYTKDDDDGESTGDDSDEDNLSNKLCTFTVTQKDYMNQHWYHCHTCKMVDKVGVCSICARVCHKGHDVTYAKYGNFFCDCGAKSSSSCLALTKRSAPSAATDPSSSNDASASNATCNQETAAVSPPRKQRTNSHSEIEKLLDTALQIRCIPRDKYKILQLAKEMESHKDKVYSLLWCGSLVVDSLIELALNTWPFVEMICFKTSPVGCHKRAKEALEKLHVSEKTFDISDKLMVPTLGSQEGAFENVRMNFSGDQGQTIRQLISAHLIHRVTMCCLSSPQGKRQHLVAVSHDKGKVTLLQLNSLLKQADSSKKKLTLTRLSSASIPFTILSVTGNSCNEDFLAVCGLKDCHVLTFNSTGSVADHLILHPHLETGNFIIRAIWIPGSQTCLALVTADFVKIYDLGKDILSPQYYFLVPTGKIRDVTFVCKECDNSVIVIMSSVGYVYVQEMNDQSSATQGPFYITSTLKVEHPGIKDVTGQICGGGVSVYYSHILKILFLSYAQGKSFIAFLPSVEVGITKMYEIYLNSSLKGANNNSAAKTNGGSIVVQPLCQWTEVPNHPGLVCGVTQSTNNPVILMIKPDNIMIQEIKVVPSKAKIMDMAVIRHPSSVTDYRTTLILLCEDGSLRIYMASMEQTGYWLSPEVCPINPTAARPAAKKKKVIKSSVTQSGESFPVDFFEHSTVLTDIEFGGNDLLQIYNPTQLKNRLNTAGLYVVSTKHGSFSMQSINNDNNMVITGIRVLLGVSDPQRSPSFIQIFGRLIPTSLARNRWFDVPLTREESIMSDQRLCIVFGQSADPDFVTMVDSVKVYGKSKDHFGWPEDVEEINSNVATPAQNSSGGAQTPSSSNDTEQALNSSLTQITPLDKLMCSFLNVLEYCFTLIQERSIPPLIPNIHRTSAISLSMCLMNLPTSFCVQLYARALLASLYKTRQAYHSYKDTAALSNIYQSLVSFTDVADAKELDPEFFYHLVITARDIASARPSNFVKFVPQQEMPNTGEKKPSAAVTGTAIQLLNLLMENMWRLHQARPANPLLPSIYIPGLAHTETTMYALVEIIHAFLISDQSDATLDMATGFYLDLLLCDDTVISFSSKMATIAVLKPRMIQKKVAVPSSVHVSSSTKVTPISHDVNRQTVSDVIDQEILDAEAYALVVSGEAVDPINVDGILNVQADFHTLDILQGDADDETMVELAIALSLQDQERNAAAAAAAAMDALPPDEFDMQENIQAMDGSADYHDLQIVNENQPADADDNQNNNQETGHLSDTTASGPASDDECSTVAIEASSSSIERAMIQDTDAEQEKDTEMSNKLQRLRALLLERFISCIPACKDSGGLKIIPFFQVVFVLTAELDITNEHDKYLLNTLLQAAIEELGLSDEKEPYESFTEPLLNDHSATTKYHFILLRLLSTLMYHAKSAQDQQDKSMLLARMVADAVLEAGVIDWSLQIHNKLLTYWKNFTPEDTVSGALLKPHFLAPLPDTSPFFLKQYVKGHVSNLFELYPQLLTEMMVRLPYQVQKHSTYQLAFDQDWFNLLCDYMMTQQPPFVKRQVRKLLLHISPDKESYRQRRDNHALESHLREVFKMTGLPWDKVCEKYPGHISLSYNQLLKIVEHLKGCMDVAIIRNSNWRKFLTSSEVFIPHLFTLCCCLDEGVAHIILQLLQYAVCGRALTVSVNGTLTNTCIKTESSSSSSSKKDSNNSSAENKEQKAVLEEGVTKKFVSKVHQYLDNALLSRFMLTFLLDTNSTVLRYQAHFLNMALFRFSDDTFQENMLELMWDLWPRLPAYGRKAFQFIDLIGYFTIKCASLPCSKDKYNAHLDSALALLRVQNQILMHHPNSALYCQVSQFVEMDGFYLESEPCLVCNNPEVPFSNIKLTSIKVDSKFTTNSQIIKLVSSHTISKISLRITDLKRTKMVKTMIIYYNNRNVQAIVELKNKPSLWHKAKKINLSSGQTEVKIEFLLPIIACNLLIEYVDFFENIQGSSETLTCPRCSASVPSNPGVCTNCGENVFQCHKCRAINYDEKDPFLCHVCGFCKYAKFDYTLTARPICAIEPIQSDEDRKKITSTINTLLEKADRVYKQFNCHKPILETLLSKINEHRVDHADDIAMTLNTSHSAQVNKTIQLLAQKYCADCKTSFDELSRIIQKILVCRKQLVAYDQSQAENSQSSLSPRALSRAGSSGDNDTAGTSGAVDASGSSTAVVSRMGGISSAGGGGGGTMAPPAHVAATGRCYGCASFVVEHCVMILRAVSLNGESRKYIRRQGLIYELVEYNLRRGSNQFQEEVRQLLCALVRDNVKATDELCSLLLERITVLLRSHVATSDLPSAIRPEIVLLSSLLQNDDICWEPKARCVTKLFLTCCKESKSPIVLESVVLPCLNILQMLIKPSPPKSKKNKDKNIENLATVQPIEYTSVEARSWIVNDPIHSFKVWRHRRQRKVFNVPKPETKQEVRERYVAEKYFLHWKKFAFPINFVPLEITSPTWLKPVLFNNSSVRVRVVTSSLIYNLCDLPMRKKQILDVLTSFLGETSTSGQYSIVFLDLYQSLIQDEPWKQYLTLRGVLTYLAELISKEIQVLHDLEETTLTSDLSQGIVLKKLVELMASFLEVNTIKRNYKGRLVGSILNGYLSLRRLIIQRTRIIDETQEKLLELLEAMTTGTEAETKSFMAVCTTTVETCSTTDIKTPVFIFERLCSIIFPEENDVTEFYLSLEKDPQQEDFLQGRMVGNPYNSSEAGLGPLMRDVKNKICQDCELIALLEDDNGMELLVNNKIISLDLPVKLVYKKIWLAEGATDGEPMRVVYRMRGLLGDATEEFIETLDSKSNEAVDNEEVYKLANTMGECGGLDVLLNRLDAIKDLYRYQELTQVCLKLLSLCVKVKQNQQLLILPEYEAMKILLDKLQLCLEGEDTFTDSVLSIIETLLVKATADETDFMNMIGGFVGSYYIRVILDHAATLKSTILGRLMHVAAALTYGNEENMKILMGYFLPIMNFENFEAERVTEADESKMDMFCIFTAAIDRNPLGNTLKDYLKSLGFVDHALEYITSHASVLQSYKRADSDEWKDYIARPALKYVLRYLTGLAYYHKPTQMMVSAECISIIHRLEQVSSDEHVGTLAENLLEALRTNPEVASRIEDVREQTKAEKKRLAMAMREKQLGALGMRTNEKGQVTAETSLLQHLDELAEETGLICVICREGYRFQPTKVLGIYTFTKRCIIEEFENKTRKTYGYSTVTHFNVVHIECHMSAVRLARTRDEWDSAALQNGNTKCNGLLPLWGPQVTESVFASALARHNTYLQECTGNRDISYITTIHDLKLLLLRFAKERSFHEDSGGGGPQSNMNLIPYLMHMALYVINTTKSNLREEKNLMTFLDCTIRERWIASAYETEGPFYWLTFSMLLHSPLDWAKHKITHLRRLLIVAHVRHVSPTGPSKITDFQQKDYAVYKSALVFFGLINIIYKYLFQKFKGIKVEQWPVTMAEYIRCNDETLFKASEKLMSAYEDELLGATSFPEYCDLTELLEDNVESRQTFLTDLLSELDDSRPSSSSS